MRAFIKNNAPFLRIVWPFAIAETFIWAATFYAFPALLLEWERELGWTKTELSGAFTLALIVTAVMAPIVGRIIDRDLGREVFMVSIGLGAVMLVLMSRVTAIWQFYVVWFGLGVAMSGMLYEACFALLTRVMGADRKRAITFVTLVAGFASTVSFAGFNALNRSVGWRNGLLVMAAVQLFVVLPLVWYGSRFVSGYGDSKPAVASQRSGDTMLVLQSPIYWLLAIGFVALALNHSVLITHLLPLLSERGIADSVAVGAASLIGPMQVAGRIGMMAVERRVATLMLFALCFVSLFAASLALLAAVAIPILIYLFVLFQGSGNGVSSILRPSATVELLGERNFGVVSGLLAVPFLGATAAAPTIAALIWRAGGYNLVLYFALAMALLGLATLLIAARLARTS